MSQKQESQPQHHLNHAEVSLYKANEIFPRTVVARGIITYIESITEDGEQHLHITICTSGYLQPSDEKQLLEKSSE